jgi:hypothetical protein
MLLSDTQTIRDVVLFPTLRPEQSGPEQPGPEQPDPEVDPDGG